MEIRMQRDGKVNIAMPLQVQKPQISIKNKRSL